MTKNKPVDSELQVDYTVSYDDIGLAAKIGGEFGIKTSDPDFSESYFNISAGIGQVLPSMSVMYKINIKNNGPYAVYLDRIETSILQTIEDVLITKLDNFDSVSDFVTTSLTSNKIIKNCKKRNFFSLKKSDSIASKINEDCGNLLSCPTKIKPNEIGYINFILCFNNNEQLELNYLRYIMDVINWAISSCLVIKGHVKKYYYDYYAPVHIPIKVISFTKPNIINGKFVPNIGF